MTNTQFHTDNKHTVVCVLKVDNCSEKEIANGTYIGKAYCHYMDTFDLNKGKDIAYERALLKLKKAEKAAHEDIVKSLQYFHDQYEFHKRAAEYQQKRIDSVKFNLKALVTPAL